MIGFRKRYAKPGTPPGTLQPLEVPRVERISITLINYDEGAYEEREASGVEECFAYRDTSTITWINVTGLYDVRNLQKLGEHFGLHPLALEDVLHTGQRPKLESYDDHLFIVLRMLHWQASLRVEQVSLFLGDHYVITFQETEGDVFEPVRERLRAGRIRIRKMGADYLAYALIDRVIDELFPILETYGERLEDLEDQLIENPTQQVLHGIYAIKRDLVALRRAVWPERELINAMMRDESRVVRDATRVFLRDCYDHTIQIVEIIETYRDLTAGMMDLYLSVQSNRMNEIMKVLTIIATVFIPLTFIAGIYGMNFNPDVSPWNMPELNWYWGYPLIWLVMLALVVSMFIYFRRKNWL